MSEPLSPDAVGAEQVSVLLVDDHDIWRGGVKSMLWSTEFTVVGEAASGHEAIEVARLTRPRITLLDIRMADGDGFLALVALKKEHPRMAVVMLTSYENPTFMARAVAGGASGYLLKGIKRQELIDALRAVVGGETLLRREDFVHSLRGLSSHINASVDLYYPLTDRELDVLRLLATGLNNREIGELLFIGEGTVKTHIEHIIHKLGVSDRVQAAVWAARLNLVTDQDLV